MIYMIGGAPRTGKSILCQKLSARLGIGWISTDLLMEVLRSKNAEGIKTEWDASPEAIIAAAEWSFPYIERFVWGVSSMASDYVIEGVDFLPLQVVQLSRQYEMRSIFLGCSRMTPEIFDQYPGKSKGYINLPEETRHQFADDISRWSEVIKREAKQAGCPYIDTSNNFHSSMLEAENLLTDI